MSQYEAQSVLHYVGFPVGYTSSSFPFSDVRYHFCMFCNSVDFSLFWLFANSTRYLVKYRHFVFVTP